jgi:hypothetical protein
VREKRGHVKFIFHHLGRARCGGIYERATVEGKLRRAVHMQLAGRRMAGKNFSGTAGCLPPAAYPTLLQA